MPQIDFIDNHIQVENALRDATIAFLHEAGGEIAGQAGRNSRRDQGQTAGSYTYKVDESTYQAIVGSPLENAMWEEFGTGEYAVHGDGRKGGWYIHESRLTPKAKSKMKKVIGRDGQVYYFTRGKKPNKPLERAFNTKMGAFRAYAEKAFGNLG